jgi:uncharacterized repeat protein (TIGR03803 family)
MFPILFGLSTLSVAANGIVFSNLYSFTGGADGATPSAPLIQASNGIIYSTTEYGGYHSTFAGYGTIFQITLGGVFTSLYAFENWDGDHPFLSGLTEDSDGLLYGTTIIGGDYQSGEVFVMAPDSFLFPIYSFAQTGGDGFGPQAGVTLGTDGGLYGTTSGGGTKNFGTIFQITYFWDYTNLFSFNGTNGATPYCNLIQGRDGNLYGTTFYGGSAFHGLDGNGNATGYGTIFKITTNGVFTSLFSFSGSNGAQPLAGLVQARDGNLYGTTELGGANGYGTVFKITTNGAFTSLFSFTSSGNGAYPVDKLVEGPDGNLYGTTADLPFIGGPFAPVGNGIIFRITPSGEFTKIYSFPGRPGGVEPVAGLLLATDGNFYGTCLGGLYGYGMVFRLSVPIAPMIQDPHKAADSFTFKWNSVAGLVYQPQYKTNLNTTVWNNLGPPIAATNGVMSASDSPGVERSRFYRVVLLP